MSIDYPPGRPPRLSAHSKLMIWVRYQLWFHNRPQDIAADFNISTAYVSIIGRDQRPRKDRQCQPHHSKNPPPRSPYTSSPPTLKLRAAAGPKAGTGRSEGL